MFQRWGGTQTELSRAAVGRWVSPSPWVSPSHFLLTCHNYQQRYLFLGHRKIFMTRSNARKGLEELFIVSHLSPSRCKRKISWAYLLFTLWCWSYFLDTGSRKTYTKSQTLEKNGFLLHHPIAWTLIASKNSFPRLGRWVKIILLGAPTSESMIIVTISMCIPLSLHRAGAHRVLPPRPATPGEGFVFWDSPRVWHTQDVVNSVFVAWGRQTDYGNRLS